MAIWFAAPIEKYPHYNTRAMSIVSATNADGSFPATNLLTYDPTQVFRTTTGSTVITINVQGSGSGKPDFDVIALLYTNASYRATWTVEVSDGGVSWTTVVSGVPLWANLTGAQSSTLPDPPGGTNDPRFNSIRRNHAMVSKTGGPHTHVRVTITDPVVTNITIGRFYVGKKWYPTYGWQYGSSISFTDYGRAERTERGVQILDPGRSIPNFTVKMDFLTKTEMYDYIYNFNQVLASSNEFLACLDDVDTARLQKNLIYCTISEGRMVSIDTYNTYSQSWVLESIA
jgi:hypothetical protein